MLLDSSVQGVDRDVGLEEDWLDLLLQQETVSMAGLLKTDKRAKKWRKGGLTVTVYAMEIVQPQDFGWRDRNIRSLRPVWTT